MALVLLAPATAAADAPARPPCPAPALAYDGSDDVVREVRLLRDDVRAVCLAARDDADVAQAATAAAHEDATAAHDDATASKTAIDDLATSSSSTTTSTVSLSAADVERTNAQIIGLGLLAGLTVVGLLMPAIRRFWT